MALFQKKPFLGSSSPLYTLGANKTVMIIGLGNPGAKYDKTRHNIGFAALDDFASKNDFPGWLVKKDLKAIIAINTLGENRVVLVKPTTFMNNSGEAASLVQHFYQVYNQNTLAVYDELAIEFGQLRTRLGGSDAGHNGVKSLVGHIGEDFGRLRIGIGGEIAKKADAADFVLGKFNKEEQAALATILSETSVMITEYIFGSQLLAETRSVL
jgi:peptidyl-tRNA hydrolase, PTH1 family